MLTFDFSYFLSVVPKIAEALPFTFFVILGSAVLGILAGILVAIVRIARIPVLFQICGAWLSFVRSMPFVLLLFLMYFTVPAFLRMGGIDTSVIPKVTYVLAAVVFGFAPVIAEVIRPAYFAIDKGQHEAALVFGLSPWQRIVHVIIPQMVPMLLPPMVNQVIEIVKDTSLMYMLGLMDIMGRANMMIHVNMGRGKLENYIAVALLYWAIVAFLEMVIHYLNKKNSEGFMGRQS